MLFDAVPDRVYVSTSSSSGLVLQYPSQTAIPSPSPPASYDHFPAGTTPYGCFPMDWWQKSELYMVNGSSAYVVFRPAV